MISETVILAISTMGAGLIALIARLAYSSKCALLKCCCCQIQRDIAHEPSLRNITGDIK